MTYRLQKKADDGFFNTCVGVAIPEGRTVRRDETRWSTRMGQVTQWRGLVQNPRFTANPDEVREFAAALLAAADAADEYRRNNPT